MNVIGRARDSAQAARSASSFLGRNFARWWKHLVFPSLVIGATGVVWAVAPSDFPVNIGKPIADALDGATRWLSLRGAPVFDCIRDSILLILAGLQEFLLWLPWPVFIGTLGLLAWRVAGWGVGLFTLGGLLFVGFMGLWESAMETLALMFTAVVISVAVAIPTGVVAARNDMVDSLIRPLLDGMQTMPSFVYLVPAILFFSLGNVPAVMATVLYAVPPAIRLTNLGIRQVSPEVVEAARAFGSTSLQLLFKVQIPLAMPTIMAGINQTVMMALAMVVVASLVGAGGLGEDVLRSIGRLEVGNGVIAGLGIVILAIMIDRISQAVGKPRW